jgi:hypothetical protein
MPLAKLYGKGGTRALAPYIGASPKLTFGELESKLAATNVLLIGSHIIYNLFILNLIYIKTISTKIMTNKLFGR